MFFAAPTQSLFRFVIEEEWTALAAAYYNTIGFFGAFFASLLFGLLADRLANFTAGWLLLSTISLIGIVGVLSIAIPTHIHSMTRPLSDMAPVPPRTTVDPQA